MSATATETSQDTRQETTPWTIWAEGYVATREAGTAWHLNESPILAASFDDAVRQYVRTSEARHLFRRRSDGTWTYWGCRLFDNEADARNSFG